MQLDVNDFDALIRQHQIPIWQYLRYLGAGASEADDLTQEAFLVLYRSRQSGTFDDQGSAATQGYLRTVAKNQLLMLRRREGKNLDTVQLEVAESVWAKAMNPNGNAKNSTEGIDAYLRELDHCREQLEGRARQAVDWFYQDDLGRNEIAQRLKMKPQGVKTLLRRTRQLLRACVERGINQ